MCDETICHLFISCPKVREFLLDPRSWLQREFNVFIELNPVTIIFCYFEFGINLLPENVLILSAKNTFLIVHTVTKHRVLGFRVFLLVSTMTKNTLQK